jgi:hypothetical protein
METSSQKFPCIYLLQQRRSQALKQGVEAELIVTEDICVDLDSLPTITAAAATDVV